MCNEDLNIVGTVTQVFNTLEIHLTFHGSVGLLPILLREGGHILRIGLVKPWLATLLVEGHRGMS
jgi:hypothetical protein